MQGKVRFRPAPKPDFPVLSLTRPLVFQILMRLFYYDCGTL
jgi:hypothetical protein